MFVTGSGRGGFPCEYALSEALAPPEAVDQDDDDDETGIDWNDMMVAAPPVDFDRQTSGQVARGSISVSPGTPSMIASQSLTSLVIGAPVCESLDDALKFAEDILIAREDPSIARDSRIDFDQSFRQSINVTADEEKYYAGKYLRGLLTESESLDDSISILLSLMERQEFISGQKLWEQGADSDSAKLLLSGELTSIIEDTGAYELVKRGNIVGELGLVHGTQRLTTLICSSEKAVLYSLSYASWQKLLRDKPEVATLIQGIVIRYLAHRVQHVNNRYFHTTLPV